MVSEVSEKVWVVKTATDVGVQYYYAALETIGEAVDGIHTLFGVDSKEVVGANRVKNVDHVPDTQIRRVPEGDYTGPLIP